jgi:hypothetical protein
MVRGAGTDPSELPNLHNTPVTFTLTVQNQNQAPTAEAGGPYNVDEGTSSVLLSGSGSDPENGTLTYAWDLDSDGQFDDSTAQNPIFSTANLDGLTSRTVALRVTDNAGVSSIDTAIVTIKNVAPTISQVTNDGPINEGSPATITVTASDPAGNNDPLAYEFDCDNDGTYAAAQSGNTFQCTFSDEGSKTVGVRVSDGDGGLATGSTSVTVNNVAPVVNAGADATIDEGGTFTSSGSFTDPGSDSFSATVDYGDGSGPQPLSLSGKSFSLSHTYAQDGTYTVTVKVNDDDTSGTDTASVTVKNVAPSVNAGADDTIDEGDTFSQSGSFTDPGSDSFTATVDYGDGSGPQPLTLNANKSFSLSHKYADDGIYTVKVTVNDDDTSGSDTASVTVKNVAPTATKSFDSSADEGSSFRLELTNPSDPSSADTNAGFKYAFDCGSGYGSFGSASSTSCSTTDNGTRNVKAQIRDKDGGVSEYTGTVTVNNVAPTNVSLSASSDKVVMASSVEPNKGTFTGSATDVSGDTISWKWSVDGGAYTSGSNPFKTAFSSCGSHTVSAKAVDEDGGESAPVTKTVSVYDAAFSAPLKDGTKNQVQKGQVIPVKVTIGCNGTNLTGLQPYIQLLNGNQSPESDSGSTSITTSVSSADSGQLMRAVDGGYIYNLRVPSDSAATTGKEYTIRVNPFGPAPAGATPAEVTDWNLATGMYSIIQIRK